MAENPYLKYKEQSVSTMTEGELLVLLYETCSKRLNGAVLNIEKKQYELAHENIIKAKNIITHLDNTLDRNYEISQNLSALYDFFLRQLTKANIRKDKEMILEIIPMIEDLGKTFKEAEKLARKQRG